MKAIKYIFIAWLIYALAPTGYSQWDSTCVNLNSSDITTDFFIPKQTLYKRANGSSFDPLTYQQSRQFLFDLNKTKMIEDPNLEWDNLKAGMLELNSITTHTPIFIGQISYTHFSEEAQDEGWLEIINNEFVDLSSEDNSIYDVSEIVVVHVDKSNYYENQISFILEEDQVYFEDVPELMMIDFDDGLGMRELILGEIQHVVYQNTSIDRHIKLSVFQNGVEKRSGFNLRSAGGTSTFPLPDPTPPWIEVVSDPNKPYQLETDYQLSNVEVNAYTLMSEDQIFDKPFIFVEGIDFSQEVSPIRNGSFGWYELTSGLSEEYPMLQLMPSMLNSLRDQGYDIVLVDFKNGADYIQKNAEALRYVIDLCNNYKEGKNELVIAGASMGGVISRYTLKKMELRGQDHCTKIWISLDTPHQGANIPIGLQGAIGMLASEFESAQNFMVGFLKRPAARQLLIEQLPQVESIHQEFMSELNEIGYPDHLKKLTISNGSVDNFDFGFEIGHKLLDYECPFIVPLNGPILAFDIKSVPPLFGPVSTVSYVNIGESNGLLDLIAFGSTTDNFYVDLDTPRYDNCPGGKRNSVEAFVDEMNLLIDELTVQTSDPEDDSTLCELIEEDEFERWHSFIPTVSAFGIDTTDYYIHCLDYVMSQSHLNFDYYEGPLNTNEIHSQITMDNMDFVLNSIDLFSYVLPSFLSANSTNEGIFNFKSRDINKLGDIEINNGGKLYVNADLPLHFNEGNDQYQAPVDYLDVYTAGCDTEINVNSGGLLQIGDGVEEHSGALHVIPGGIVRLNENSVLKVSSGSDLIIENGGKLILNGGSLLIEDGGRCIVDFGGEINYIEGQIDLEGIESILELSGSLRVDDFIELDLDLSGTTDGKIVIEGENHHFVGNGYFMITGNDEEDVVMELADHAIFKTNWQVQKLTIKDAKILLDYNSQFFPESTPFLARFTSFDSPGFTVGVKLDHTAIFSDCYFLDTRLNADMDMDVLTISNSAFEGSRSIVKQIGGRINVISTTFNDIHDETAISTSLLSGFSMIRGSSFEGVSNSSKGIYDDSDVTFSIRKSTFSNLERAVDKFRDGELRLKCNEFNDNEIAVFAGSYSMLNMNTNYYAGYNVFENNEIHVRLNQVEGFNIYKGYNQFGDFEDYCFQGTMIGSCDNGQDCDGPFYLASDFNSWQQLNEPPLPSAFQVYVSPDFDPCTHNCPVAFHDSNPVSETPCSSQDISSHYVKPFKLTKKSTTYSSKSGLPIIVSSDFDSIPIDIALHYALSNQLLYPENAFDLFYQILTQDIDWSDHKNNEWRDMAFQHMKTILERFLIEPSDEYNQIEFNANEEKYRQVLNLLTQNECSARNYNRQFCLEIHKMQFFISKRNPSKAMEILENLNVCGIDSLEFDHSKLLHLKMEEFYQLDQEFEANSYQSSPMQNYFVGSRIGPDGQVYAPLCESAPEFKSSQKEYVSLIDLYPNPNPGKFFVKSGDVFGQSTVKIHNINGEIIDEFSLHVEKGVDFLVECEGLAPGIYLLSLESRDKIATKIFTVE